ncbi:MAG TPA: thioredoxin [Armatimonadetes bacterium]|nr:thioredoxin [Armatimonadota bacterium]
MIDETSSGETTASTEAVPSEQLPRFVEVGADSCVPCKMMQPVLDELRSDYAGKLQIEFADIWKTPELGEKYRVRSIPTQIIYDGSGNEVFRHLGFWPKKEIDAKLKELGIIE